MRDWQSVHQWPLESLNALMSDTVHSKQPFSRLKPTDVLTPGETQKVYLLRFGVMKVSPLGSHKVIGLVHAPHPIGIFEFFHPHDGFQYTPSLGSRCQIQEVAFDDWKASIDRRGLWLETSRVLAKYIASLGVRFESVSHTQARAVIHWHIQILAAAPQNIRATVPVLRYLQERTSLSRSMLFKVVSELREQGILTMEEGILLEFKPAD
ncbi:helix-turn-helix domain-containing protein [Jeongeupia naejangsanensis]|uniref:Helix-turn-helix domain-containing protein n=1 Tax=Jeongeupia naejangsanensis TaxID=613195 RepID=A0ABS2BGQ7_9NEIS|nr:helix-turn-helix domain-containing protein [Jeongeupia naejangsanensis]MBM3114802.1 helix-turn-helix domain-containing protein [Jeongeupia naejangsanensis]